MTLCTVREEDGTACRKQALYAKPGERAAFCKNHRKEGMVNAISRRCTGKDGDVACTRLNPAFGLPGETPCRCQKHALAGMENLCSRRCEGTLEDGTPCTSPNPSFGEAGARAGIRCGKHKAPHHVNIRTYPCQWVGEDGTKCKAKQPRYNIPGQAAQFCEKHATGWMVDVTRPRCEHTDAEGRPCRGTPNYDMPGGGLGRWCEEHAPEEAIHRNAKRCEGRKEDGTPCEKVPYYDVEGGKGRFCADHCDRSTMRNVRSKTCEATTPDECPCDRRALWGEEGGTPKFCREHKGPDMVLLQTPVCLLCPTTATIPMYKPYCYRCFCYMNPDSPVVRNFRTKERAVADYLQEWFPEVTLVLDKPMDLGCSKYRPDVFVDMGEYTVVVETDEDQHRNYETTCETARLMTLFRDAMNRPMVVIRFNPDAYVGRDGKTVPSCWGRDARGLCKVVQPEDWEQRLEDLGAMLSDIIAGGLPKKELTVHHLFYDWK